MGNYLERVEKISEAAKLHLKGFSHGEIAKKIGVSRDTVKSYIDEWQKYIEDKAAKDPEILDKYLENTLKFEEEISDINKEIWDVIEKASENDVMSTKIQALRLAKDLSETKAKLFQLLSPRMDSGFIERTKRVERVNSILSRILRDVVSECPRCSDLAWTQIREAYSIDPTLNEEAEDVPELESG